MGNHPPHSLCKRRFRRSFTGRWPWPDTWMPWISAPRGPNYFLDTGKLFYGKPRLYRQDHSRGRGLTTTGQPTVSPLPQTLNTGFTATYGVARAVLYRHFKAR